MLRPRGSMMAGLPHGPHYQHRPRADNSKKQVAWLGSTTVKVQCHQAGFPKSQINQKKYLVSQQWVSLSCCLQLSRQLSHPPVIKHGK